MEVKNKKGEVIFTGDDLRGADLSNADLSNADLSNADLSNADLHGANFRGAELSNANFEDSNLEGADLRGANLCGANLKHAYLGVANLSDANLHGANLEGADLVGANLIYVNLTGACFSGAKLDYEDMEYVKNGGAIVEESIEELNKEAILFVSACKLKSTKKKEIDLAENEYNDAKSNLDLESSKHLAVQEDFDRVIINSNTVSCNFERELKIAIGLVKSSDCSNSSLENLDAIIVVNDAEIILFKEIIAEKKTLLSESEYRLNLAKEEERKEKDKLDEARSEYEANEVKIALYLSKV